MKNSIIAGIASVILGAALLGYGYFNYTTTEEVLKIGPITAHIPVIALSANAMPMNVKSGLEAGFFRYLTKPIVLDELAIALDRAFAYADALAVKKLRAS